MRVTNSCCVCVCVCCCWWWWLCVVVVVVGQQPHHHLPPPPTAPHAPPSDGSRNLLVYPISNDCTLSNCVCVTHTQSPTPVQSVRPNHGMGCVRAHHVCARATHPLDCEPQDCPPNAECASINPLHWWIRPAAVAPYWFPNAPRMMCGV